MWNCEFSVGKFICFFQESYAIEPIKRQIGKKRNPSYTEQPSPYSFPRRCRGGTARSRVSAAAVATPTPGRRPPARLGQRGSVGTYGVRARVPVRAPPWRGGTSRGPGGLAPGLGPAVPGCRDSVLGPKTALETGRIIPNPATGSAAPLRALSGGRGGTDLPGTQPSAKPLPPQACA